MTEYNLKDDGCGHLVECDSCGCTVPLATFPRGPGLSNIIEPEELALCEVCSRTMAGRIVTEGHKNKEMAVLIAQVANLIIEKIEGA